MTYRIIDKTTKKFLRDDTVFNKETEQAIMSVNAPQYGIYSKYMGGDTEQYHCIWTDTRTSEDLAKIKKDKQRAIEIQKAKDFIIEFDYVENKVLREKQLHDIDILDTKSDRIDMTYREILLKKEHCVSLIEEKIN